VVGILTDRDICMAAYTQGRRLREMVVGSAMSRQVFACHIGDSLETAEGIMQAHQVRRVPVLGFEDRVVGLLSLSDIAREAERQRGRKGRDLSPDAIGTTLAAVAHARSHEVVREI
jgi:CBS-domain-containing membrane protein